MANEAKQFTIGGVTHDVMDVGARQLIAQLQAAIDAITSGDTTTAIKTFQEVIDFLDGVTDDATLIGKLNELRTLINAKYSKPANGIPASDLANGVIPDVSGFTTKTYVDAAVQAVQTALNNLMNGQSVTDAIDTFNEIKAFLEGISSSDTLAAKLALLTPQSRTINSKPLTSNIVLGINDIDGLAAAIANAGSGAVSVIQPDDPDGTFTIRVGETDYTINLNHTHEGMAKLVVDSAANLPDASEMESDTIYGELDDGEIATIYLGGYPFYGGGGGASSGPVLRRPVDGSTIDMGQTTSGTVSQTINVKGKSLTQALIIQLNGTGYSFGTTQPSGVTRDSATQLTIPASSISAVNSLNGVDIVVVYTGNDTDEDASGTLGITSAAPDSISTEATLVANKVTYEDLAGVKLTGTQWLQTDYKPNANTEFEMRCRFIENANSQMPDEISGKGFILACVKNTGDEKQFGVWNLAPNNSVTMNSYGAAFINESSLSYSGHNQLVYYGDTSPSSFLVDNLKMFYRKSSSNGVFGFNSGGTEKTVTTSLKTSTMESPMMIGKHGSTGTIYCRFDLVIYELKITEGGTVVRDYVPRTRNGIPGLLDVSASGSHEFISSETNDELVAIPLT